MASSNRHWPSLFKSKPCSTHSQWQHDINPSSLLPGACQKSPYAAAAGCEERSPEPKPRWNPKPEQIRILEAIFNSGMVNPPRDEIRRIRAQLQEYGQVGDANVFYWFQNRKSRSKHKQRHLLSARSQPRSAAPSAPTTTAPAAAATSSSSSSSDRSSGSEMIPTPVSSAAATSGGMATMINASVDQTYFHGPVEFSGESFILQGPQGYCLSASELQGIFGVAEQGTGVSPGLWGELMGPDGWKSGLDETKIKMQWHYGSAAAPTAAVPSAAGVGGGATTAAVAANTASPVNVIHGFGAVGSGTRSTVFINEVAFEVGEGPLNVREAFGEEAVLLHSSGHPVIVDDWGLTLHPLQHGASYYLV